MYDDGTYKTEKAREGNSLINMYQIAAIFIWIELNIIVLILRNEMSNKFSNFQLWFYFQKQQCMYIIRTKQKQKMLYSNLI